MYSSYNINARDISALFWTRLTLILLYNLHIFYVSVRERVRLMNNNVCRFISCLLIRLSTAYKQQLQTPTEWKQQSDSKKQRKTNKNINNILLKCACYLPSLSLFVKKKKVKFEQHAKPFFSLFLSFCGAHSFVCLARLGSLVLCREIKPEKNKHTQQSPSCNCTLSTR